MSNEGLLIDGRGELNEAYYRQNYIATVHVRGPDSYRVLDGKEALKEASRHTTECFVRDANTNVEVRLRLKGWKWVIDKIGA